MLQDALLQLSNAQAVTATAVSTNTIDLGVARDLAPGSDLYVNIGVDTSATAAGAATVLFQIISSATSNLASPTVLSAGDSIPVADLQAGRRPISLCLNQAVLNAQPVGQRYLGVRYVVTTGPLTAGAFTAYLSNSDVAANKNYPSGFAVV